MGTMLGRHHPTARRLRALRRDPALREAESVFLAEGLHLAQEALAAAAGIELAVVSGRLARDEQGLRVLGQLRHRGLPLLETSEETLAGLQDARSPQPILLLVRRPQWSFEVALTHGAAPPLVVLGHGLQDPGNLGSLMRTADAAAATGLFATGTGADVFHPRAVRASMGSIFRLPALEAELEDLFQRLGERGVATIGADPQGTTDYRNCDYRRPLALLFGSEGAGLTGELLGRVEQRVRIPMRPGVESLSVGAAAAVLLYEAARQREGSERPDRGQ